MAHKLTVAEETQFQELGRFFTHVNTLSAGSIVILATFAEIPRTRAGLALGDCCGRFLRDNHVPYLSARPRSAQSLALAALRSGISVKLDKIVAFSTAVRSGSVVEL